MRNRTYGGVRGRKMKVGGNYFIFLLLDFVLYEMLNKVGAVAGEHVDDGDLDHRVASGL